MIEQQQSSFLDLSRAGIRTAAHIAKATLENAQRLQTQQAEVLRQAIDDNTRRCDGGASQARRRPG